MAAENGNLTASNGTASEWDGATLFRVVTIVLVMIVTLLGNVTLICVLMFNRRQRRKRVNIFVLNLAVGDLMVCCFTDSSEILFVAFGEWVLGAAGCKIVVYIQMVTLASTTFLITGMAIDRYQVIVQPFESLTCRPSIRTKVITAWLLACFFASPQLLVFKQTDTQRWPDGRIKYLCQSKGYTAEWQRKVYFTFLTSYILLVPVGILSFCYFKIIGVVWSRASRDQRPAEKSVSRESQEKPRFTVRFRSYKHHDTIVHQGKEDVQTLTLKHETQKSDNGLVLSERMISSSRKKVIKMTLSIIVGFLLCWSPYLIVGLVRVYSNYKIKLTIALSVTEIMTLMHSALNPILYLVFSSKLFNRNILRNFCSYLREIRLTDQSDKRYGNVQSDEAGVWCAGGHNIFVQPVSSTDSEKTPNSRNSIIQRMAIMFAQIRKRGGKQKESCDSYDVYVRTTNGRELRRVSINFTHECCSDAQQDSKPYSDSIVYKYSSGRLGKPCACRSESEAVVSTNHRSGSGIEEPVVTSSEHQPVSCIVHESSV